MARVCVLLAGNISGGGAKMPIRLASHLAARHDVTVMYPVIEHLTLRRLMQIDDWRSRATHAARSLLAARRPFVWRADLDPRVKVQRYLSELTSEMMAGFDAVIYPSVWQYFELRDLALPSTKRIHWSLADYFFSSGTSAPPDAVLESYLSNDVLVAPSQRTRRDLEKYGARVTAVIGGGIDEVFHTRDRERRDTASVLGYYQPAWWVKGAATLLQVVRRLRLAHPQVRIEMLGHQPSTVGTTARLLCDQFHTGLPSAGVAALLRRHDVVIYPSYTDGFPSPPLEAMACGCAVATTNVGSVPEYAEHGKSALLCDPLDDDALFEDANRLVHDRDLRHAIGAEAATRAREWRWEDRAAEFERLF